MDTPLEESNLAGIGSDEDKNIRLAAAKLEVNWEGAGQSEGIQIWRVHNKRTDNDVPDFGIEGWPESRFGEFYRGDSYIVLQTQKDGDGALLWDIYFWIGSESTQDEYGVAAYKANELDDLLGDKPVQHREAEQYESHEFIKCFPKGMRYLEGGVESGFRYVGADSNEATLDEDIPDKLFQVKREDNTTRCYEVSCKCESLNDGDAFILDTGNKVFTWFGSSVSPFERNKSATVASNIVDKRGGHCEAFIDVGDDDEDFWTRLGGKGDIAPAGGDTAPPAEEDAKMYVLADEGGKVAVTKVDAEKGNLDGGNVCLIDMGSVVIVWIGGESSKGEQQQAMRVVDDNLRSLERAKTTAVYRILEGQESRCPSFARAF